MWLASADPPPSSADLGGAYWQTALALLLTCLLAVVVLRLLRPRGPRRGGQALRLVAQLPLEGAQAVYLLRAAGRYLLVGSSPGGLALLREMDPAEVERALQADAAAEAAARPASVWQRLRGGTL